MINVKKMKQEDLSSVREMIIALRNYHEPGVDDISINLDEFVYFLQQRCMHGLMLKHSKDAHQMGCLIYLPDVSPILGGRGFELNQFYIETAHRQRGFGRLMIQNLFKKVLKSNGTYVKVVFQSSLNLDHVYTQFGFTNLTTQYPGLHLFMIQGKDSLQRFLFLKPDEAAPSQTVVKVLPFSDLNSAICSYYPPWQGQVPSQDRPLPTSDIFPQPRIIHLSTGKSNKRVCMFTEQGSLFCWSGLKVYFSDFVGDTSLITASIVQQRVAVWLNQVPAINTVEWEVACDNEAANQQTACGLCYSANRPLVEVLLSLQVRDSTADKGINIAYIGEDEMRRRLGGY